MDLAISSLFLSFLSHFTALNLLLLKATKKLWNENTYFAVIFGKWSDLLEFIFTTVSNLSCKPKPSFDSYLIN